MNAAMSIIPRIGFQGLKHMSTSITHAVCHIPGNSILADGITKLEPNRKLEELILKINFKHHRSEFSYYKAVVFRNATYRPTSSVPMAGDRFKV